MPEVLVGLGSNLGDRAQNLRQAISGLAKTGRIVRVSPVFETSPVGFAAQPDFLNACLELETALAPEDLLAAAARIESELARVRRRPNGPRTIDIDLLLWRDPEPLVRTAPPILPHPRLHQRRFVLEPLARIAADWQHPTLGRSIRELLDELSSDEDVRPLNLADWPPAAAP